MTDMQIPREDRSREEQPSVAIYPHASLITDTTLPTSPLRTQTRDASHITPQLPDRSTKSPLLRSMDSTGVIPAVTDYESAQGLKEILILKPRLVTDHRHARKKESFEGTAERVHETLKDYVGAGFTVERLGSRPLTERSPISRAFHASILGKWWRAISPAQFFRISREDAHGLPDTQSLVKVYQPPFSRSARAAVTYCPGRDAIANAITEVLKRTLSTKIDGDAQLTAQPEVAATPHHGGAAPAVFPPAMADAVELAQMKAKRGLALNTPQVARGQIENIIAHLDEGFVKLNKRLKSDPDLANTCHVRPDGTIEVYRHQYLESLMYHPSLRAMDIASKLGHVAGFGAAIYPAYAMGSSNFLAGLGTFIPVWLFVAGPVREIWRPLCNRIGRNLVKQTTESNEPGSLGSIINRSLPMGFEAEVSCGRFGCAVFLEVTFIIPGPDRKNSGNNRRVHFVSAPMSKPE